MGDKIKKEAVLYAFNPETQYTCGQCFNRKPGTNICALFGPEDPISPDAGSCGFYAHEDGEKSGIFAPVVGVIGKLQAGYAENKTGFSCKRCEYFIVGKNDCKKVDRESPGLTPGKIHPNSCCNNWEADARRAKMKTEELLEFLSKSDDEEQEKILGYKRKKETSEMPSAKELED